MQFFCVEATLASFFPGKVHFFSTLVWLIVSATVVVGNPSTRSLGSLSVQLPPLCVVCLVLVLDW